jgi:hypothetical protein
VFVVVLDLATENSDNPDLRDRGYVYWRLLSTNPVVAKAVVSFFLLVSRPLGIRYSLIFRITAHAHPSFTVVAQPRCMSRRFESRHDVHDMTATLAVTPDAGKCAQVKR